MSYRHIEPFTQDRHLQQDHLVWQHEDYGTIYQTFLKIAHPLNSLKRDYSVMLLITKI